MMSDLLSGHLDPTNIRYANIDSFIQQVEATRGGAGTEWLGNTFVICTGGIKRSPLTRRFLEPRVGGGQLVLNQLLPATAMKGFNALDLPDLKEELTKVGKTIVTLRNQTKLDTIIFHISPAAEDLNSAMSLVQLVKLLNEINREGEKLGTKLLLIIDDEYTVSEVFAHIGES